MSLPCVFFDRDGVVNRPPPDEDRYVLSWEKFELMPGLVEVLRTVKEHGYAAIVVTSQRGVGLGLMTREELDAIHAALQAELDRDGVPFLDFYACTHTDEDRHWAKPDPGMILEAAREHDLDVGRSLIIGDADRDIVMGQRAGVGTTIRLRGGKPIGLEADHTCDNLLEINELLGRVLE